MSNNNKEQGELTQGRIIVLNFDNVDPPDADTEPTLTMSPNAPTGLKTTGLLFILESAPAYGEGQALAPFTVTIWLRNPVNGVWGSSQSLSGVGFNEAYVTYDFDAAEVYFQIVADEGEDGRNGLLYLHAMEQ